MTRSLTEELRALDLHPIDFDDNLNVIIRKFFLASVMQPHKWVGRNKDSTWGMTPSQGYIEYSWKPRPSFVEVSGYIPMILMTCNLTSLKYLIEEIDKNGNC